ncbi:MAG: hypothetical protein OQK76_01280, partial [Gammaproteobacteria bacterium]|nr:hypothetical protein [Gammaproteobacteria bacterium]
YRDVPEQPAFTVVPVNFSVADYKFKENVELSLIEMGLSVIESPLLKQSDMKVDERLLRAKRNMKSDDYVKKVSINELIETSKIYNQSNADYVILVNAETSVLKITKRDTHEIQALIKYSVLDKSGSRFIKLHDALVSLGFKVRTVSREEKLKMEYPLKEKSLMRH